jgi:hypothetical protein
MTLAVSEPVIRSQHELQASKSQPTRSEPEVTGPRWWGLSPQRVLGLNIITGLVGYAFFIVFT